MEAKDSELAELSSIDHEIKDIDSKVKKLTTRKEILLERKEKLKELIQKRQSENLAKKNWSLKTFPWSNKVDSLLRNVFKLSEFRPFQLEVINATLSKEDVITIMPTGGGKSLCYQLPALVDKGITLVVSPLVSLMEDQLMSLKKIDYPAIMLSANSTKEDLKLATAALKESTASVKLIYVTPEKLAKSKRFMSLLQKCYEQGRFSRLAIDEVHCCSTWGHDFRPDYSYLGILKDMFQGVPLLGLTATSTSKVTMDVQKILNIQGSLIIKAPFNRPNLYYEVVLKPPNQNESLDLLENWLKGKFKNKSGVIYTTVIKDCEELTKELRKRNVKAGVYHAMLDPSVRSKMHAKWMSGEYQVIVATIAFGMGIDKPDVRFVIHHALAKSLENFYQESGRAGRDGETSHCILMYRLQDVFKLSTMVFTQQSGLENLYDMLKYCLDIRKCRRRLIAEHFDEEWEFMSCNKMCDNCKKSFPVKDIDVTSHCRVLYKIIDHAHGVDVKVTVAKLLDAWFGRGDSKLRLSNVKCSLDKITAEKVIGLLLIRGYLKEDFHYTPYSTLSYIKKGPKYGLLEDNNHHIQLEVIAEMNKTSSDKIDKSDGSSKKKSEEENDVGSERRGTDSQAQTSSGMIPGKNLKRAKESADRLEDKRNDKKIKLG